MNILEQLLAQADESAFFVPALSVMAPYGSALAAGVKPIENRTWSPPLKFRGSLVLIHQGKGKKYLGRSEEMEHVRSLWPAMPPAHHLGAFVGIARLRDCLPLADVQDPWAEGPMCWRFDDAVEIEPITYQGALGLFYVPKQSLKGIRLVGKEATCSSSPEGKGSR